MENSTAFPETLSANVTLHDVVTTTILKTLVGLLSWSARSRDPEPLNLTAVVELLDQLTDTQIEELYNATKTTTKEELIHLLNVTIMQPREYEISLMEFPEYRFQKILLLYIPPILILLGTFGNLFSFIVLRRKPMLKVSSYMYLAALAVIDTLVLYNGLLRIWMVELMRFDYQASGNWICKLTVAFGYVSSDLSVWLIIAVTVERYIVVCFPFQASSMCNVSRARKVIVGLLLLMLSLNVHFMWTAEIVEEQGQDICRGGEEFRQLVEEIWPWVDTLIYSFLPFVTITILNILIIREVAGARSTRIRMTASEPDSSNPTNCSGSRRGNSCEGTRLTALLLTVSFTFLLLTLPNNIALIVSRFWNQKYDKAPEQQFSTEERMLTFHHMSQFKLIMTITELLMYTNHSINFFLYCATGNKFRQQIFDLFRCFPRQRYFQTQTEHTLTSHTMRKTSPPVLAVGSGEMALAQRTLCRKSSCVSGEDIGKHAKEISLEGKRDLRVNKNCNVTGNANMRNESVDATNACSAHSSGNEMNNFEIPHCQTVSLTDRQTPNSVSLKTRNGFTNRDSKNVQLDSRRDVDFDNNKQPQRDIITNGMSCNVYRCSNDQRDFTISERGHFGTGCGLISKDKEYFLMKLTSSRCDTLTKS